MDEMRRRKNIRIVLAILAVIPIGLLVYNLIFLRAGYSGDSIEELAFTVFGIPILVFNYWAWYYSEMIEHFLWVDKGDRNN
jgi:hypothetical protein